MNAKIELPPKGSQARIVFDYMAMGHSISSIEAIYEFGILRLPNRISELRNKYSVKIFQKTEKNPKKPKVKWQVYSLAPFE